MDKDWQWSSAVLSPPKSMTIVFLGPNGNSALRNGLIVGRCPGREKPVEEKVVYLINFSTRFIPSTGGDRRISEPSTVPSVVGFLGGHEKNTTTLRHAVIHRDFEKMS